MRDAAGMVPAEPETVAAAPPRARGLEPPDAGPNVTVVRTARVAEAAPSEPGFAAAWKDRAAVTAEPVELAAASQGGQPAAEVVEKKPVRVASQDEVNEMDLAAAKSAITDSFWLRGLFLALGGLLAVGSALRFLV
jgi:hypothetical protein